MSQASKVGVILDIAQCRKEKDQELQQLTKFRRVVDYLAGTMIYLKDNFLMQEPLKPEHIKDRLLGHWGTCPGLNLVYAHGNYLLRKHNDLDMFIIVGPGHGAPATLACLYTEGTLGKYYSEYQNNAHGLEKLLKGFSWPGGFPSHVNSQLPGTIHEGGELGYALSTAFGAVFDKPNLVVTAIIGDGEAETGPTATAWHSYKYLDPKESGAVLPIIHVNGFKISSRTLYGMMGDDDLVNMFTGYGYQVRVVEDMEDIEADMAVSMEWALTEIRKIQKAAREGNPIFKPKWPLLILRTPKGMGGIKMLNNEPIEGSYRSHGVPAKDPQTNPKTLKAVEEWFTSYKIQELIDVKSGVIKQEIIDTCPTGDRRVGCNPLTNPKFVPLSSPDIHKFQVKVGEKVIASCMNEGGKYLAELIKMNPTRFRIVSPDELESNKMEAVLKVTHRNYQWDEEEANRGGRVSEMLSEHTCQGWMQGYVLTGGFCLFPSYESFLSIVATMMVQWAKFIKMSQETIWRNPVPSINYIETSTLWRQEHNGFSHQNPMFLNNILNLKSSTVRVYLPPDANCFVSTLDHCLNTKNYVNLIVSSKHETPSYLTMDEAVKHCCAGASVWKFCSTDDGVNPDVVLACIGCEVTIEVVEAARLLKRDIPQLRVRVVNITDLMILDTEFGHPHGLNKQAFESLFTADKPVIFNFHGYGSVVKQLLFDRGDTSRFSIHAYKEEGSTTTVFSMLTANETSRYDIAKDALLRTAAINPLVSVDAHLLSSCYDHKLRVHKKFAQTYGLDPADLNNF